MSDPRLAVCITTHIRKPEDVPHRHTAQVMRRLFEYYRDVVIKNYMTYDTGLDPDDVHIFIMDTGSDLPEFDEWMNNLGEWSDRITRLKILNHGGAFANIKHVMHGRQELFDHGHFDYFLFHIDDGVEVVDHGWAKDMIECYEKMDKPGVMGRHLDTIDLGPDGLIHHRNRCDHFARMWGIEEVETIPHLHGDYWLMNQKTVNDLADCWYDEGQSLEDMAYQRKWEDQDFKLLYEIGDGNKTLDDIHIGREVDVSLRVTKMLALDLCGYTGTKIKAKQLHHRR